MTRLLLDSDRLADIKNRFSKLLHYAPAEIRTSICALLPAVKRTLDMGYHPLVLGKPLQGWRCLLTFLTSLATMQAEQEVLLRVSSDLLAIADHMTPPDVVLQQSAKILVYGLRADVYVCRLRSRQGLWKLRFADAVHADRIPLFPSVLDERLQEHPLMRAVFEGHTRYVVSNNLQSLEHGGDSYDDSIYAEGYRSRLSFVLRERSDRPPFGLVTLYTKREGGFDLFDEHFLAKYAKIVSLTVGRRVAVTRDTLEKAAGAMAHYGNNVLHQMRTSAEYCDEVAGDIDCATKANLHRIETLCSLLPKNAPAYRIALDLANALRTGDDIEELLANLRGITKGTKRMETIIKSLEKSAEKPRLIHYVQGRDVLRLDDSPREEAQTRPTYQRTQAS